MPPQDSPRGPDFDCWVNDGEGRCLGMAGLGREAGLLQWDLPYDAVSALSFPGDLAKARIHLRPKTKSLPGFPCALSYFLAHSLLSESSLVINRLHSSPCLRLFVGDKQMVTCIIDVGIYQYGSRRERYLQFPVREKWGMLLARDVFLEEVTLKGILRA